MLPIPPDEGYHTPCVADVYGKTPKMEDAVSLGLEPRKAISNVTAASNLHDVKYRFVSVNREHDMYCSSCII